VGSEIAAVILEPVPGNMGVVLPEAGFLEALREITRKHGALLIFDEVISGFRIGLGGAQACFGIEPDLTCLGKVIGGGLPVGAYGGRREIMERMAPVGGIYQAGTLSGNPLAMAAGLATLGILKKGDIYEDLDRKGAVFFEGIRDAARSAGLPVTVNRIGSMGSVFFTTDPVRDFASAKKSNVELFRGYYTNMLQKGIYLAPSAFEASFLSIAHDEEIIQETLACAVRSLRAI
jgi:glutamate-1-semialdehyde 2,1-aminomutase